MVRIPDLTDTQLAQQIAKYTGLAESAAALDERTNAKAVLYRLEVECESRSNAVAATIERAQSAPINVSFEAGVMALKGGRHEEAEIAFLAAARDDPRLGDAWSAIGMCKLYQLANGRTMDEALHAFSHAKRIEPQRSHEVDRLCIEHSSIVVNRYYEILQESINEGQQATGRTILGGALAMVSTVTGLASQNTFVQLMAVGGVGSGAAVAVSSLSNIHDIKVLQRTIVGLVFSIRDGVDQFVDHGLPEYRQFSQLAARLSSPSMRNGLTDAARSALPPAEASDEGWRSPTFCSSCA